MAVPTTEAPSRELVESVDNRVLLHGVSWADYERLLEIRGDGGGVRLSYLEGELELMSPSRHHEGVKTRIARLLEAWAEERRVDLNGFGSWTIRSAPRERGLEALARHLAGDSQTEAVRAFRAWLREAR